MVAERLNYNQRGQSSSPKKQGGMGDLYQLKETLEQKITTWQCEVDLKLNKSA